MFGTAHAYIFLILLSSKCKYVDLGIYCDLVSTTEICGSVQMHAHFRSYMHKCNSDKRFVAQEHIHTCYDSILTNIQQTYI